MNTLPEDIQIKIYKMAHQMKLMDVMSELISEFDYMCYLKAKKDFEITNICPQRLINYYRTRYYHATHVLRFHKSPEYLLSDGKTIDYHDKIANYDSDESSDEIANYNSDEWSDESSEDESDN